MYNKALILGAAAFLIATPFGLDPNRLSVHPMAAEAAVNVSIDVFFNTLQPYGSWVHTENHPYVFVPANVGPNWVPYTNGHWIYTEQFGWYFELDEPIAAITYHYGRWGYSDDIGWYWVPGTRWAPAWVAWRRGTDHVGWAPLPPEGTGYAVDVNVKVTEVPQQYWVFVPVQQFLAPQLNIVVETGARARGEFEQTKFAGPVVVQNNVIVNNVIDINFIEQQTKQKVVVHQVQQVNDPRQAEKAAGGGAAVKAFVADVQAPKQDAKPKQVVDVKAAKAKQLHGGDATANAGAAGAAGAAAADANAKGGEPANVGAAAGKENCKPDTAGKMPANCTAADKSNAGAAATAEANKPKGGAPAKAGGGAAANAGEGGAAGIAGSDNCKPDAAGKMPANCKPAGKADAGAAANAEINKPTGGKAGAAANADLKQPSGAAGQKPDEKKGASAAVTDTGNATADGKKKPAGGQAADNGKGKGCTPQEIKAGTAGCGADAAGGNAAGAGPAVSQEKTGSLAKDGKQPDVQTGQAGQPEGKCTPEMKNAKKC